MLLFPTLSFVLDSVIGNQAEQNLWTLKTTTEDANYRSIAKLASFKS